MLGMILLLTLSEIRVKPTLSNTKYIAMPIATIHTLVPYFQYLNTVVEKKNISQEDRTILLY